jgi:predicted RNA binding protein YcfA (HicA-like mRNA interferase family)
LPVVSGDEMIAILRRLGFREVRQKGSHVFMFRQGVPPATATIPRHKELDRGTLRAIMRDTGLSPRDLRELL